MRSTGGHIRQKEGTRIIRVMLWQVPQRQARTDMEEQGAGAGTLVASRGACCRALQEQTAGRHGRRLLHRQHLCRPRPVMSTVWNCEHYLQSP